MNNGEENDNVLNISLTKIAISSTPGATLQDLSLYKDVTSWIYEVKKDVLLKYIEFILKEDLNASKRNLETDLKKLGVCKYYENDEDEKEKPDCLEMFLTVDFTIYTEGKEDLTKNIKTDNFKAITKEEFDNYVSVNIYNALVCFYCTQKNTYDKGPKLNRTKNRENEQKYLDISVI